MAYRGNTGSHEGKTNLFCILEKYICAVFLFFLCFAVWHNADFAFKSLLFGGLKEKIFSNRKNDLQSQNFRVNITHHTSKYFLLRVPLSVGASLIQSGGMDWLCHPCRPRCLVRNSGILVYQPRLPVF